MRIKFASGVKPITSKHKLPVNCMMHPNFVWKKKNCTKNEPREKVDHETMLAKIDKVKLNK